MNWKAYDYFTSINHEPFLLPDSWTGFKVVLFVPTFSHNIVMCDCIHIWCYFHQNPFLFPTHERDWIVNNITLSAAWSPDICRYHHHQFQSEDRPADQTLPISSLTASQLLSYLDYLDDIREHGNPIFSIWPTDILISFFLCSLFSFSFISFFLCIQYQPYSSNFSEVDFDM